MITEKIRILREQKKLRHEDMAERLNISQSAYSRLEKGDAKLDVERLQKIAEVLEVPVEDLLNTEPLVFNVYDNKGGANGYVKHNIPEEFVQKMIERFNAQQELYLKQLQEANVRYQQLAAQLLKLLERKL
ncbi:MAG TPA: helix-turn-helix domain-containing protein [Flavobacteriales bacterium]|mgnify:CR=1 FL=1|nr:helix-turn-helix domain-containing protein [Flavobacteriales bacterium]HRQ85340.1 helix-turn-helix domain-containing protein [Flavobacteriales bacterium]